MTVHISGQGNSIELIDFPCWCEWVNVDLRRFLHNHSTIAKKEARCQDCAILLFRMTSRVLYSAQNHRQNLTLHAFEQFGALYMHNNDIKYPSRSGFEPGTSRPQAQSTRMSHRGRLVHMCIYYTLWWEWHVGTIQSGRDSDKGFIVWVQVGVTALSVHEIDLWP